MVKRARPAVVDIMGILLFFSFVAKICNYGINQTLLCPFGAKKLFLFEMVQKGPDGPKMGPKWSKTLRLTILVPFGPFWTTLEC